MEPDLFGELAIDVPVTDVNVAVRLKTGLYVRQHVLRHPKIDSNAMTIPNLLLPGGETVGATADDESKLFCSSDHFYSNTAGRVAEFHSAIDVKADQESQLSSSLHFYSDIGQTTLEAVGLDGGNGAPNQRVAGIGHRSAGDADLCLLLDLRGRSPLQLEDAVPMVPPAGASVSVVTTAGGNGIRSFDADIGLVEVKSIAPLLTTGGEPQPLEGELMEQGEAIVHVFERQIVGADARAFIENPPHAVGALFPLLKGGRDAWEFRPGLAMAQDVNGLLLVVSGSLWGGEDNGQGGHNRQVVVVDVCRLGDPSRREIVLDGDHLRPMLAVVPVRIHKAVPALSHHEIGHLIVILAVLPAVLLEDHRGGPASRQAPDAAVL